MLISWCNNIYENHGHILFRLVAFENCIACFQLVCQCSGANENLLGDTIKSFVLIGQS